MISKSFKYIIPVAGVILINSCKLNEKYTTPEVGAADQFRDTVITDTSSVADIPWQEIISDTILQNLIEEGLQNNLDVKTAIENINQAQATLQQAKMAQLPSLSVGGTVTHKRTSRAALNFGAASSSINLKTTTYTATLSASWEADIWGKLRSAKRAALASYLQTEAATRAVQTQLISDIAVSYYNLLAYDAQLAITRETLENRKSDQVTMGKLQASDVVDGSAVVQSEASRYEVEVSIPDIEVSILEEENALSILLGRNPGPIERSSIADQDPYSDLNIGIPSDLLRNRPDIQEAEMAFRSAFENVKMARAYFYPSLTLTPDGGISTLTLQNFFNHSVFYDLIAGLTQPIFAQNENKARLKTNESLQAQAFYAYKTAWMTAGQEISNALFLYKKALEKQEAREKQVAALEKSVRYTKKLLEYTSTTNYTDVLTSQESLLSAQLSGVDDKLQELQAIIQLYRALGGGWKSNQ